MRKITILIALTLGLFAESLDYNYKFGGRVDLDLGYFGIADDSHSNSQLRRARVFHKGSILDKKFFYEVELDLSDISENLNFKDLYVGNRGKINGLKYRIKAGNIKPPFSLDSYSSSKYSSFMESSLTETFTENRKMGVELLLSQKIDKNRVNIFLGAFENSIDETIDGDDEVTRGAFKVSYGAKLAKMSLIYVGSSYLYSSFDGENRKYKHKYQYEKVEDRLLNVNVKNIDSTHDFGLEALYINRGFHFQAEYLQSQVDADSDLSFSGYYAQLGYFLFGGSKKFKLKEGKFSRSRAKNDIELALRFSVLDLTEKADVDNSQDDLNFALNWHIDKNLKLMTSYSLTSVGNYRYSGSFQTIQSRLMVNF